MDRAHVHRGQGDRGRTRLGAALTVVLAVGLVAALTGALWAFRARSAEHPSDPSRSTAAPAGPSSAGSRLDLASGPPPGLVVLRTWDARRAAAWAAGDTAALAALYTRGSPTGRRDVAMLRAYARRGLVVRGLRQQVLAVRVLQSDAGHLRLAVTERLAGATAVGFGVRRALPAGQAARHVVALRRDRGRWRVVDVRT